MDQPPEHADLSYYDTYNDNYSSDAIPPKNCSYKGTDNLEVKIVLIGIFATSLAIISLLLNAFLTCVFILNPRLRRSPLYYFGIIAVLDIIIAFNYLALMTIPVYMDHFNLFWLYQVFLVYVQPMLTLSNFATFASVLLIILATIERLLRTFSDQKLKNIRINLEKSRPQTCFILMCIAFVYKLSNYFEIMVFEHENCSDWKRYELMPADFVINNEYYQFWWMFMVRNLIDRIIPFFMLIFMNFLIIRILKQEQLRSSAMIVSENIMLCPKIAFATNGEIEQNNNQTTQVKNGGIQKSFKNLLNLNSRGNPQRSNSSAEEQINRKNLRAATRALISLVTLYLLSQSLLVVVTFLETFFESFLADNEYIHSYLNDACPMMTLLASACRFPLYCACNKSILTASKKTFRRIPFFASLKIWRLFAKEKTIAKVDV